MMNHLADEYNLREKGLFYVDLYPMQYTPVLVIASPEVAAQVTQINSYPKTTALAEFAPVLGRRGLVSLEGTAWKDVRTMFNPGFSNANLLTMVPMMVEETQIFASRLSKIAAGDGFASSSETLTAELTIDIIGRALFGIKFNSQNATNPLVNSLIQASHLIPNGSDISPQRVNLWRELKLKYHEKIVNTQVMNMLRMRWSELASSPQTAAHSTAIFDIAMATYMKRGGKVEKNVTTNFLELMRDKYESPYDFFDGLR
jgi:cytochrome P450